MPQSAPLPQQQQAQMPSSQAPQPVQQSQPPQQPPQQGQGSPRNSSNSIMIKQELSHANGSLVPPEMSHLPVSQQPSQLALPQQQPQQPAPPSHGQQSTQLPFGMMPFPDQSGLQMPPNMMAQSGAPSEVKSPLPAPGAVPPQAPGGVAHPVQVQHMMQGGPQPPQQVPEWFHEEKDTYMTLQERMGLV
jgi:hypothetical protein